MSKGKSFLTTIAAGLGLTLQGCYTQFYSQGYLERANESVPEYGMAGGEGDTLSPADSAALDSARRAEARRAPGSGTVIVNNYYHSSPYYRGYPITEWDYPAFSFSVYSSGYRDYWDPYWWDEPWLRDHGWHDGYHGGYYNNYRYNNYDRSYNNQAPSGGGAPSPYHAEKRIYTLPPDYPTLHKGRRSAVPRGQPKASAAPQQPQQRSSPPPANNGQSNDGNRSSSADSGSSNQSHPAAEKGHRR